MLKGTSAMEQKRMHRHEFLGKIGRRDETSARGTEESSQRD